MLRELFSRLSCVPSGGWSHGDFSAWSAARISRILPVSLLPGTFICYQMMAARGRVHGEHEVCRSLEDGEVEMARHHVSMIVGRDTSVLDRDGIARAAVETVAENASDGVIAPFFVHGFSGTGRRHAVQGCQHHGFHGGIQKWQVSVFRALCSQAGRPA